MEQAALRGRSDTHVLHRDDRSRRDVVKERPPARSDGAGLPRVSCCARALPAAL